MIDKSWMRETAALSKYVPEFSPLHFIHFIAHLLIIPVSPATATVNRTNYPNIHINNFTDNIELTKNSHDILDTNNTIFDNTFEDSEETIFNYSMYEYDYSNNRSIYFDNHLKVKSFSEDEMTTLDAEINNNYKANCLYCNSSLKAVKEGLENAHKGSAQISILGLFDLTSKVTERPEGLTELAAAQLAVEHINKIGVLPGYKMKLYTNDTMCDPGVGIDRFFHALYTKKSTRMIMLLGTACSDVTESLAKIVPYWNIVQVSFGATSPALSDRSEYPFFFRTVAADCSHNPARIAFLSISNRRFNWNAVIALSQNEEMFSLATNELVTSLEAANISCTASLTFSERNYKEQLLHLKELDTRIIIGSFEPDFLAKIFCEVYRLGMVEEEYVWIIAGSSITISPLPCKKEHLSEALEGVLLVSSYSHMMKNDPPPYSGLTYESFVKTMNAHYVNRSPNAAHVYDAVFAMAIALRNAEKSWALNNKTKNHTLMDFTYERRDMAEDIMLQFESLNFTGVSGPVSFNGPNRVGTTAFQQVQSKFTKPLKNGTLKTLALYHGDVTAYHCERCAVWRNGHIPVARSILRTRVIRPAPSARLVIASLALTGVSLALGFLLFNLHYAELRSIKLSSPRLTNMTLVGCVLVYSSVALVASETDFLSDFMSFSLICTSKVYLLAAGFSLAFGSMFAKTYRVHRIFISKYRGMCKTKLLQDTQLITLVCALLLIDGFIVTLWVTTDPMEKQLRNLTREVSSTDRSVVYQLQIEICRSHHMTLWLGSLYVYKGLLLIMGVYMAWETRHVKISALNDSKYIGMSVYCVVTSSAGAVVLENIISERITLVFVTTSGLILLTTTGTLCLLFLPKLYHFLKNSDVDPVTQSMGLKIECNTRRFVTTDPQEIYFRTEIQNKVYKKELIALDKEIQRLEKILLDSHSSTSSSATSLFASRKIDGELGARKESQRIPSISGGLPMLLLSILPPVIPRASWPSAYNSIQSEMRKSVTFSSQPKLFADKAEVENMLKKTFYQKEKLGAPGIVDRIRGFFGSRPMSRKPSTASVSQGANTDFSQAFKMHMDMVTGLVNKDVYLQVPLSDAKNQTSTLGPKINITCDSDSSISSSYDFNEILPYNPRTLSKSQSFEPRVHFDLRSDRTRKNSANYSVRRASKGSPRFPHKLKPVHLCEEPAQQEAKIESPNNTSVPNIVVNNINCVQKEVKQELIKTRHLVYQNPNKFSSLEHNLNKKAAISTSIVKRRSI